MNKRRLLKLADLLEADAKNKKGVKFDLGAWAKKDIGGGSMSAWSFKRGDAVPVSCNTAACAWGLAAISGVFKRQGVGYRISGSGWLMPTFDGKSEFSAAKAFFAIEHAAAEFLFDPTKYPLNKREGAGGERFVAKRIRDFVAGKVVPESA